MRTDETQRRLLMKGAEYFATAAAGRDPGPVDRFVAELLQEALLDAAGGPLPTSAPDAPTKKAAPAATVDVRALLKAHGFRLVYPPTVKMIKVFLAEPETVFPVGDVFKRLKMNPDGGGGYDRVKRLVEAKLLTQVKRGHYQLAIAAQA